MHYKTFSQHLKKIKRLVLAGDKDAARGYVDYLINALETREHQNRDAVKKLREARH